MESCDIAHKIVETVSRNSSCSVEVNAVIRFHYFGMIRYLKIGNNRFAVSCDFNVFAVIFAYGNGRVYHLRNDHHYFLDFFFKNVFFRSQFINAVSLFCDFCLYLFRFFFFALRHKSAYEFGRLVSL